MIKITLDSKYKALASQIRNTVIIEDKDLEKICRAEKENISELAYLWFGKDAHNSIIKVIERIHSADAVALVEPRCHWRLKSEKFDKRYIGESAQCRIAFYDVPYDSLKLTESKLKKLLEGTGLPFEAFEKVEADEN